MAFERFQRNQKTFDRLARFNVKVWQWLLLAVLMTVIDYLSGPTIQFPVLFVFPVMLASWFTSRQAGFALAVLLPTARLFYGTLVWHDWFSADAVVNTLIRVAVFSVFAMLTSFAADVRVLRGLIAICGHCKKIRDETGTWSTLEAYMEHHSEALFSHGICPDCLHVHYGSCAQRSETATRPGRDRPPV